MLVADPDPEDAARLASALRDSEFRFAGRAASSKELLDLLWDQAPSVVALDLSLPDHPASPGVGWMSTVYHLRRISPNQRVLLTFSPRHVPLVPASILDGAGAFAEKPFLPAEVLGALRRLFSDDKRPAFYSRARRVPCLARARFRRPGRSPFESALLLDLSVSGARLALPDPPDFGCVIELILELPGGREVAADAQIVRELPAQRGREAEIGVAFIRVARVGRDGLDRFLAAELGVRGGRLEDRPGFHLPDDPSGSTR